MGPDKKSDEEKGSEGQVDGADAHLKEIDEFFDNTEETDPDYDPASGSPEIEVSDAAKAEEAANAAKAKEAAEKEGEKLDEKDKKGEEGDIDDGGDDGSGVIETPELPKTILVDGVEVPVENLVQTYRQHPGLQATYLQLLKATEAVGKEEEKKEPEVDPLVTELEKEDPALAKLYTALSGRLTDVDTRLDERDQRDGERDANNAASQARRTVQDGFFAALTEISTEEGYETLTDVEESEKFTQHLIEQNAHPANIVNPLYLKGAYAAWQGAKGRPARRQKGSRARSGGGSSRATTPQLTEQEKEIDNVIS